MVVYEVQVEVREDLRAAFETYMREKHLPEILATGCFAAIRFDRSEEGLYRTCYEASSRSGVERYLRDHTAPFRDDFMAHFPEGCQARRVIWDGLARFTA